MGTSIKGVVAAALVAGVLFAGTAAPAGATGAHQGTVTKVTASGSCSAASTWALTLAQRERRRVTGVKFEVTEGTQGDRWRVKLSRNGHVFFRGARVTQGDDGSFRVRLRVRNPRGIDTYDAAAKNTSSGETCVGQASI
jgi:hypothetical protein